MWMNHHELFKDIERLDHLMLVCNLLLLLSMSFIPFPTAVLAEALHEQDGLLAATLLYGGTFTVNAIFFNALWLHASYRRRLLDEHVSDARVQRRTRRFLLGPLAYGVTLPIAFISPWASLALFVGYSVLYLLPLGE